MLSVNEADRPRAARERASELPTNCTLVNFGATKAKPVQRLNAAFYQRPVFLNATKAFVGSAEMFKTKVKWRTGDDDASFRCAAR